jgi:radical SAM superfamily enzyme YgiQ (UPF0313 family)
MRTTLVRPAYSAAIYGEVFGKEDNDRREIRPPLGLMALAGYLRAHNRECVILDGEPELWSVGETCSRVLATNPTYVGVTSTTPEWPYALEIIHQLRRMRPEIKIILGGPHVTTLPHQTLREAGDAIDWAVLYEGEVPLLAIVEGRAQSVIWAGSDDPRLLLAPNRLSVEELSSFVPSREAVDMSKYKYVDTDVGLVANDAIESARGCPFGCAFCTSRRTKLVNRSVGSVVDEILMSARMYNTKLFMFFDDTVTINRERATEIFTEILAKKQQGVLAKDVKFYGFTRANTIDFELMKLIKEAGGDKLTIGVETGDETILQQMGKGTKLGDYVQAYRILDELHITKRGSFIVGHPYETERTVRKSIDFAISLDLDEIGVNIMTPFPGQLTFRDAMAGRGIWFSHDLHYRGTAARAAGEPWRDYAATDWADYWKRHLRWQSAVIETEELSSEAIAYWHARFLQEVYGSPGMERRRNAKIAAGMVDEYWHRPWRVQSRKNAQRIETERQFGQPRFAAPRHLTEEYSPVFLEDFQKQELHKVTTDSRSH